MTFDFWGLGLQAINVVILVWLLSRVFWRPVAGAIAKRQKYTHEMLDRAQNAEDAADKTMSEITELRAGIAAEREVMLANAANEAQAAAKSTQEAARHEAEELISAAKQTIARESADAARSNVENAATLSVEIASKLLTRLDTPTIHAAFLALLIDAIAQMSAQDQEALTGSDIDVVSHTELAPAEKARVSKVLCHELGDRASLKFVTDTELVAGLELRTPHFVLRNSWQADLQKILEGMAHAG